MRNLANIAKPAELPPLKPKESEAPGEVKKPKLPIIGKRKIGTKKPIQVSMNLIICKPDFEHRKFIPSIPI